MIKKIGDILERIIKSNLNPVLIKIIFGLIFSGALATLLTISVMVVKFLGTVAFLVVILGIIIYMGGTAIYDIVRIDRDLD